MINVLHVADKLSVGGAKIHGITCLFSWWIPCFDKTRFRVSVCSLRIRDRAGEFLENLGIEVHYLARGKFDPRILTDLLSIVKCQQIKTLHLCGTVGT